MTDKQKKIIEAVAEQRPYKQSGNAQSYSSYNEGWTDACYAILDALDTDGTLDTAIDARMELESNVGKI